MVLGKTMKTFCSSKQNCLVQKICYPKNLLFFYMKLSLDHNFFGLPKWNFEKYFFSLTILRFPKNKEFTIRFQNGRWGVGPGSLEQMQSLQSNPCHKNVNSWHDRILFCSSITSVIWGVHGLHSSILLI